jgi:hypothetical protein
MNVLHAHFDPQQTRIGAWLLLALALALMAGGCATARFQPRTAVTATPAELRTLRGKDKRDHLVYMGSDRHYHYVLHCYHGGGRSYRVPRSEWHVANPFPLSRHETRVLQRSDFPRSR